MASSAPGVQKLSKAFLKNAAKRKDKFIQWSAMSGIFMLSMRSLGQKYRLHDLKKDTAALKEEHQTLEDRMSRIKRELLHEASIEPTGVFAARLRRLFAAADNQ